MYHAVKSDFEKVKEIFYLHKKWFPHVRTDYMKRMIAKKNLILENDVVITSFWKEWVEETKSYSPEIKTGWLVPLGPGSQWNDRFVDEAIEAEFNQLCPRAELITPTLVNKIKNRGLEVRCHGVFDEDLMIKAVECGVDGMTINFPDKLRDYLSENGYLID